MTTRRLQRWVRRAVPAGLALATALAAAAATLVACGTPTQRATNTPSPTTSTRGAAPAALQTGSATARPPAVKQFAPYDAAGRATVKSVPAGTGTCFATSIAVPVSGVYRCLAGNTILDPCFASVTETDPATLACFADPWSTGQLITLSGKLPAFDPVLQEGDPWAIQLANGVRCVSVTGALPVFGDIALSYRCGESDVAGLTTRDDGTAIAHYGPSSGPLVDTPVTVEWRGRSFRLAGTP